jgi:hypothetical protein
MGSAKRIPAAKFEVQPANLQQGTRQTYKLAYPPSHLPMSPFLQHVRVDLSGQAEAARFSLLSSVKKAPRDIFCCSFFLGAMRYRR